MPELHTSAPPAPNSPRGLLRRLSEHDDECLGRMLVLNPGALQFEWAGAGRLDRRTVGLVRLAALLALDAPMTSLRWVVDMASASGVEDVHLVAALVSAASAEGAAQVASGGSTLAQSLGYPRFA